MKQLLSDIGSLYCCATDKLYESQEIWELTQKKAHAYQIQAISGLKVSLIATADIHFVTSFLALLSQDCSVLLLATDLLETEKNLLNQEFMSSFIIEASHLTDLFLRTKSHSAEFCLSTSGTTGRPKIINCTINDLRKKIDFLSNSIAAEEIAVSASVLSLSFGHGLIGTLLFPLLTGQRVILIGPGLERLLQCGEILNRHQVSFISATPHSYRLICRSAVKVKTLKRVQSASSSFEGDFLPLLASFAPNAQLYNAYGLSEFYSWISFRQLLPTSLPNLIHLPPDSILLDEIQGINNQEGCLYIKATPHLTYWQGINDVMEWKNEKYLGTGDIIKMGPEGYQLHSRKDDRIEINAIKFYPQEIEDFYKKHLHRNELYFVHLKELKLNTLIIKGSKEQNLDERITQLAQQLAGIKRPQRIIYLEEIPHTKRGKISRKELERLCLTMIK